MDFETIASRIVAIKTLHTPIMHLSFASPWVDPLGTHGNQGEWYSFGISFFREEEGSCLVLKTTTLGTGTHPPDLVEFWLALYRSRPKFFRAILFHFDAKFRLYVVGVHTFP